MPQKKVVPPTGSTFVNKTTVRPGVCNLGGYTEPYAFQQGHRSTHATMGLPRDKSKVDAQKINNMRDTDASAYQQAMGATMQRFKTKPAVPNRHDAPLHGLASGKNFISHNKENATTLQPPAKPETTDFLQKKEYGSVPGYLTGVKQQVAEELEIVRKAEESKNRKPERYTQITSEEKEALKRNLIIKYEQINYEYQKITYIPPRIEDSISLKNKRNYCESQLSQIEKYLAMLSKDEILVDIFE